MSWPHARTASRASFELPLRFQATFSDTLHEDILRAEPSVFEAFFDPFRPGRLGGTFSLHGKLTLRPEELQWESTDEPELVSTLLEVPGRFSIRIHCSDLWSKDGRMFSSTLAEIVRAPNDAQAVPRTPGGVFESWFLWPSSNG